MKFRMWLAIVCVAAAAASGLTGTQAGLAQDDPLSEPAAGAQINPYDGVPAREQPARRPISDDRYEWRSEVERGGRGGGGFGRGGGGGGGELRVGEDGSTLKIERSVSSGPWEQTVQFKIQPDLMRKIQEAAKGLHEAKDDEAKSNAQQELSELLNKYFDDDMQRREEELVKVEERLKNLRSLLEKRRAKQREIIELQIKVLLNEADGLGFFNNASPPGGPFPMFMQQNSFGGVTSGGGWIMKPKPDIPADPRAKTFGDSGSGAATEPAWPPQPPAASVQRSGTVEPTRTRRTPRAPQPPRPAAEPAPEALGPAAEAPATEAPAEDIAR